MQRRHSNNPIILDVSHHQGIINWKEIKNTSVKGVYIKLTEGGTFVDPRSYENYIGAKNAGLRVGFYHYAHCTNSPEKEAAFFIAQLGQMKLDLPPCLDLEEDKKKSKEFVSRFAVSWLEHVHNTTGIKPIVYTNYHFAKTFFTNEISKYPLWVARYSAANRQGGMQHPGKLSQWQRWAMFQYTDSGRVKGISTNVDINEMDYSFFKEVTTNLSMTNNTKGPFVYSKGDRGLGVKQIQQNLLALGFSLPKFGADGFYGDELIAAVKKFQNRYGLFSDGIAGADTLPRLVKEVNNLNNLV